MDPIQQNQISQIAAMYGFQGPLPPNVVNLILQLTENSRVINQLQAENTNINIQNQQLTSENLKLQIEHQKQLTKYYRKRSHYRTRLLSKDLEIASLKNQLDSEKDINDDYEEALDEGLETFETISKVFKLKDEKLQRAEKQLNAVKKRKLAVEDRKAPLITIRQNKKLMQMKQNWKNLRKMSIPYIQEYIIKSPLHHCCRIYLELRDSSNKMQSSIALKIASQTASLTMVYFSRFLFSMLGILLAQIRKLKLLRTPNITRVAFAEKPCSL